MDAHKRRQLINEQRRKFGELQDKIYNTLLGRDLGRLRNIVSEAFSGRQAQSIEFKKDITILSKLLDRILPLLPTDETSDQKKLFSAFSFTRAVGLNPENPNQVASVLGAMRRELEDKFLTKFLEKVVPSPGELKGLPGKVIDVFKEIQKLDKAFTQARLDAFTTILKSLDPKLRSGRTVDLKHHPAFQAAFTKFDQIGVKFALPFTQLEKTVPGIFGVIQNGLSQENVINLLYIDRQFEIASRNTDPGKRGAFLNRIQTSISDSLTQEGSAFADRGRFLSDVFAQAKEAFELGASEVTIQLSSGSITIVFDDGIFGDDDDLFDFGGGGLFGSGDEEDFEDISDDTDDLPSGLPLPAAEGARAQANQPFLVGEKGPELFMPRVFGDIVPNDELAGAMGGREVVFNISSEGADPGVREAVLQTLRREFLS